MNARLRLAWLLVLLGLALARPAAAGITSARGPRLAVAALKSPRKASVRRPAANKSRGTARRRAGRWLRRLKEIAPHHHIGGPKKRGGRVTEERPFIDIAGPALGVEVGVTVSEISRVAGHGAFEVVHVTAPNGIDQNLELVVGRRDIGRGQRLELQGPAINFRGPIPRGFRAIGVGLTSDLFERGHHRALSYTVEAKITGRTLAYWAPVYASALGKSLHALGAPAGVGEWVAGSIPVISMGLAVQSIARAFKVARAPRSTLGDKWLAAGHAAADVIRVAMPLVGTLANVALVAGSALVTWKEMHGRGARGASLLAAAED